MATQAKKELRASMKDRLSELSDAVVAEQSLEAQRVILSLPPYQNAQRIGIYLSMPKAEAQTDLLIRDALRNGKVVHVPNIYAVGTEKPKQKVMDMLRLQSEEEYESMERDSWGIPKLSAQRMAGRENAMGGCGRSFEPDGTRRDLGKVGEVDLIVMPGVAFDQRMGRLGHGAAFYDTFLTRFCGDGQRRKPYLVGLCLACQLLGPDQELVMQEWDWRIDAVASGDGRLLTSNGSQ